MGSCTRVSRPVCSAGSGPPEAAGLAATSQRHEHRRSDLADQGLLAHNRHVHEARSRQEQAARDIVDMEQRVRDGEQRLVATTPVTSGRKVTNQLK